MVERLTIAPERPARFHIVASFPVKSLIRASSTLTTTPSPIEAALPVIWAAVWIVPPPSESEKVTSALAKPWPPVSRDLTFSSARCAASSD